MTLLKITAIILVLIITLLAGAYPFFKKRTSRSGLSFPRAESLAAGVFLGAGLMHMLADAAAGFTHLQIEFPTAYLIAGVVFLAFLLLEHIGREIYHTHGDQSNAFAFLAVVMLSIHSLFTGAALGLSQSNPVITLVLLAIIAHKWAASFALAVQINKSSLGFKQGIILFLIFSAMLPLGIIIGAEVSSTLQQQPLIEPIFNAIAAGTFLYLGTLHGLERAVLIKQCCNLKGFSFVILGFSIMALVAIFT